MPRENRNTRNILSNTGYFLIVDICNKMHPDLIEKIIDIVSETLVIGCSSRGVQRIPYFGLATINLQFDVIWKLDRLKGNYSKILKALTLLKKVPITGNLSEEEFLDYLHVGLKQISAQINDLSQDREWCEDMENQRTSVKVVLITKKDGFPIKFYLAGLVDRLDFRKLHTIQIVEIRNSAEYNSVHEGNLHLVQMSGDVGGLTRLLKGWLVEFKSDREDLVIKICDEQLKCDIHEIILDTAFIPFTNSFHLHKEITNSSASYLPDPVMPVYRLEVIDRISSSGISETCVFGFPLHLRPTSTTTSDSNRERFVALCKTLYDADEYLIARLVGEDTPRGHFVLMPGEGLLLVKSIACRELMLPQQSLSTRVEESYCPVVDEELSLHTNNLVFSLPLSDDYDPLRFSSSLCNPLTKQLLSRQSTKERNDCTAPCGSASKSKYFASESKFKRKSLPGAENISDHKKPKKTNNLKLLKHFGTLK